MITDNASMTKTPPMKGSSNPAFMTGRISNRTPNVSCERSFLDFCELEPRCHDQAGLLLPSSAIFVIEALIGDQFRSSYTEEERRVQDGAHPSPLESGLSESKVIDALLDLSAGLRAVCTDTLKFENREKSITSTETRSKQRRH